MLNVHFHDPADIDDAQIKFAVIMARYRDQWIFCRHQSRDTYEIPGGKREPGETIEDAATRELFEETGAIGFDLKQIAVYSVERDRYFSYGMLYFSDVKELSELPKLEIAEISFHKVLPEPLTYPEIQPFLYQKVVREINVKPKFHYLLFDADNTLFDYDQAETVALEQTLSQFGHTYSDELRTAYRKINQMLWDQLEAKQITVKELQTKRFKLLFSDLGFEENAEDFNAYYLNVLANSVPLIDGAEELCKHLSKYCRLAIVTNGISKTQHGRFEQSTIKDFFTHLFISGEIGLQKPQFEYFDYVFDAMQITDKSKVLMVGDSLAADIIGGKNAGIATCWYNPTGKVNDKKIHADFVINRLDQLNPIIFE
ncbi:YjjG family noncanonical pyrimidine nucleotidase [Sporolactobacillus laevolacticus]|uniref:YjjG family noncanonical pyrimidine nucleotidase n=1 Tax=Sporolactobacillus laevolacticus TaxID=33018 RepID=UPI0025B331D0|nr:YjjG family noncanonical pyrimidine nucleotidase [Sporolactobacillus laevolacticus]MDN3956004.1 YjjG family noncanonical pyrimidine nucleotidase [Sporolactobacillus laevolacticus]